MSGPRIRVAGLLINGGRVLLVRHEKDGRSYWLLPGGGVEEASNSRKRCDASLPRSAV